MDSTNHGSRVDVNDPSPIRSPFYSPGRNLLHFLAGLLFTIIYWPLGACAIVLISIWSRATAASESEHRARGQRVVSWLLARCVEGMELLGVLCVDDRRLGEVLPLDGPLIIAANHPAMWDSLLILRYCPRLSCIMKARLLTNPILRGGSLFAGFLPNTPQLNMIRLATQRLQGGGQLLLFPEGTRTREENWPVNPFNPGMALIAARSRAPLLPVFIATNSPYLGKGWPIWKLPRLPVSISIRVGGLQQVREGEQAREFSQRMEALFREELQRRH